MTCQWCGATPPKGRVRYWDNKPECGSDHACQARAMARGISEVAIKRVQKQMPYNRRSRSVVVEHIRRLERGNLICVDCGSENHTSGAPLCNERPTT